MAMFTAHKAGGLHPRGCRIATVALLLLVCPSAQAVEPLTALLPKDTIACVASADLAELDRHWSATGFSRLWQSDAFTEFRAAFQAASRLAPNSEQSLVGPTWRQLVEMTSGEACFALLPANNEEAGFLLLADVSQHPDKAESLVDRVREEIATDAGIKRFCFLEDGVFGITNCTEIAEQTQNSLKKQPAESLGTSAAYRIIAERTRAAAKSPVQFTWYADPWAFQTLARGANTNMWQQLAGNGFDVIQAAGGAISLSTAKHDAEHHVFIYAPGERKKTGRLLDFSPLADLKLPGWIPADVDAVTCIQWNLASALAGYGSLFDAAYAEGIDGTFDAVLEDIKAAPGGPQVDVTALMKLQAGPVLSLSKTLLDGTTVLVYAVKVSDEAKTADALKRMFAPDPEVERKPVGKYEMWVFKETLADAPAMGPDLGGYALAAARGYLYVATSAEVLERLIADGAGPALVNDPKYNELQAQAEAQRKNNSIAWRVAPTAGGVKPLYEGFRAAGTVDLGRLLGDEPSDQHRLDASKLPGAEILSKFIPGVFGIINQVEDGWSLNGCVQKGAP